MQVLGPLIEPLTEQQRLDIYNLGQSCQQAEDALSQGMDKLRQTLADSVAAGQFMEGTYIPQMTSAMEKLEDLVSFVKQVIYPVFLIDTSSQFSRNFLYTTCHANNGCLLLVAIFIPVFYEKK